MEILGRQLFFSQNYPISLTPDPLAVTSTAVCCHHSHPQFHVTPTNPDLSHTITKVPPSDGKKKRRSTLRHFMEILKIIEPPSIMAFPKTGQTPPQKLPTGYLLQIQIKRPFKTKKTSHSWICFLNEIKNLSERLSKVFLKCHKLRGKFCS